MAARTRLRTTDEPEHGVHKRAVPAYANTSPAAVAVCGSLSSLFPGCFVSGVSRQPLAGRLTRRRRARLQGLPASPRPLRAQVRWRLEMRGRPPCRACRAEAAGAVDALSGPAVSVQIGEWNRVALASSGGRGRGPASRAFAGNWRQNRHNCHPTALRTTAASANKSLQCWPGLTKVVVAAGQLALHAAARCPCIRPAAATKRTGGWRMAVVVQPRESHAPPAATSHTCAASCTHADPPRIAVGCPTSSPRQETFAACKHLVGLVNGEHHASPPPISPLLRFCPESRLSSPAILALMAAKSPLYARTSPERIQGK